VFPLSVSSASNVAEPSLVSAHFNQLVNRTNGQAR